MSKNTTILLTVTDVVHALHIGSGQSDAQEKRILQRFGLAPHAYVRGLAGVKQHRRDSQSDGSQ